ncbi:MAG: hypothetical protein ACT4OI_09410 [Methanobacteriota archaeon]
MGRDVDALRNVLTDFKAIADADACALIARSGVPLAHVLPEESHVDNFGTMAATLLGAIDVIYSGLHKDAPARVVMDTGGSVLVTQWITEGTFLVAILPTFSPAIAEALDAAAFRAKGLLGSDEF